jgi:hypothetical protein
MEIRLTPPRQMSRTGRRGLLDDELLGSDPDHRIRKRILRPERGQAIQEGQRSWSV